MTGTVSSRSTAKIWIIIAVGIVLAVVAVAALRREPAAPPARGAPAGTEDAVARGADGQVGEDPTRAPDAAPRKTRKLNLSPEELSKVPGGPGTPYEPQKNMDYSKFFKGVTLRTVRPLRLVVRHGTGHAEHRTAAAARQRAEEARRRFLEGEDPRQLIRELSDPPLGFPPGLLKQWADLRPTEASPVIEIESGFAVFFGAPDVEPTQEGRPGSEADAQ